MQDIYIARAEGELALEEELWWALVSVYRQVVKLGYLAKFLPLAVVNLACGDQFRPELAAGPIPLAEDAFQRRPRRQTTGTAGAGAAKHLLAILRMDAGFPLLCLS
jgi:hypothetical protein